ncbi:MAG: GGDEF domain-containing protein [Bacillota bacterium]
MLQGDMLIQIEFLMVLCFSFLIFVFTLSFPKTGLSYRLLGYSFFIPVYLCILSVLLLKEIPLSSVLLLSETCFMLVFLLILFCKFNELKIKALQVLIFSLPILVFSAVYWIGTENTFLFSTKYLIPTVLAIIIINIFLVSKQKKVDGLLMRALIYLLVGIGLRAFIQAMIFQYAALALKGAAYSTFYRYFYKETNDRMMNKVNEAKQLKKKLENSFHQEVKKRMFYLQLSNEKLLNISQTDGLTQAFNKEAILDVMEKLISSKQEEFSILMFDIDDFKKINDTYGHIKGDMCIKSLAQIAKASIRKVDSLGRYGGDEFVIVLPDLSIAEAKMVAERFRKNVEESSEPRFTVSIGLAAYPRDGRTVKELIEAADKGLYKSKHKGKNAVSHHRMF